MLSQLRECRVFIVGGQSSLNLVKIPNSLFIDSIVYCQGKSNEWKHKKPPVYSKDLNARQNIVAVNFLIIVMMWNVDKWHGVIEHNRNDEIWHCHWNKKMRVITLQMFCVLRSEMPHIL